MSWWDPHAACRERERILRLERDRLAASLTETQIRYHDLAMAALASRTPTAEPVEAMWPAPPPAPEEPDPMIRSKPRFSLPGADFGYMDE